MLQAFGIATTSANIKKICEYNLHTTVADYYIIQYKILGKAKYL